MKKLLFSSICVATLFANTGDIVVDIEIPQEDTTSQEMTKQEQLEAQKKEVEAKIVAQKQSIIDLTAQADSMSANLQIQDKEFKELRQKVQAGILSTSDAEGKKLNAQRVLQTLKDEETQLNKDIAQFNKNIEVYTKHLNDSKVYVDDLKRRLLTADEATKADLDKLIAQGEKDIKKHQNDIDTTNVSIEIRQKKLNENKAAQVPAQEEATKTADEYNKIYQAHEDAKALYKTKLDELNKSNYNTAEKKREVVKAKEELANLETLLKQIKIEIAVDSKEGREIIEELGNIYSGSNSKAGEFVLAMTEVGNKIENADAFQKAQIQDLANQIAGGYLEDKKEEVTSDVSSSLNVTINNMNKRLGEIRGLDGEVGAWFRAYGGRFSTDTSHFNYYSTQIGADKKIDISSGDVITGVLFGFDKINSSAKSKSYSVGGYASYIDNSGFFTDFVLKYLRTSYEKEGIKSQNSFLASFEGGYRLCLTNEAYIEPSLELISGYVGKYESVENNVNISVKAYSPLIVKPQIFAGYMTDDVSFRAGVGAILDTKKRKANILISDIVKNVDAQSSTDLKNNNRGFVSLGGAYTFSKNLRLNLSVERSFGSKLTNDYEVNSTLRYTF